jgi:hypothetical protein
MSALYPLSIVFIQDPWVLGSTIIFIVLILAFLFKFFGVFFDFVQAQGCLIIGLVSLVGLPGIFVICLLAGYNYTSIFLIVFAVIGVITGYIARDSEGNVGKFGNFIMIISIFILVLALFLSRFLKLF